MSSLRQSYRTSLLSRTALSQTFCGTPSLYAMFDASRVKRKPFPISPVNPQICVGGALDTLAVLRDGGAQVTAKLRP